MFWFVITRKPGCIAAAGYTSTPEMVFQLYRSAVAESIYEQEDPSLVVANYGACSPAEALEAPVI